MLGLKIIEDPNMLDYREDWSGVRSRSRAERRRKRGFPQRVVVRAYPKQEAYRVGDTVIMHPEMARALRERLARNPNHDR